MQIGARNALFRMSSDRALSEQVFRSLDALVLSDLILPIDSDMLLSQEFESNCSAPLSFEHP